MNEQLIEMRIKAEKKQSFNNGVLVGAAATFGLWIITMLFF